MAENEHLHQTLDYYRQLRQQKLDQLREELVPIELMIRQLERDLGETPTVETHVISAQNSSDALSYVTGLASGSVLATKTPNIRPDEFFTMTQSEATKVYLRKVGHAVSLDELVAALRKGGAQLGGADPKKTLYVSLARNPMKEFAWPSEGYIGLTEFYGRAPRIAATRKAKTAKGRKPRREAKRNSRDIVEAKPAALHTEAMHALMQDGQPRTAAEIIATLTNTLGKTPSRMAIVGGLNSKKRYQKIGDQYQAIKQE